jgi:hypothetical protein
MYQWNEYSSNEVVVVQERIYIEVWSGNQNHRFTRATNPYRQLSQWRHVPQSLSLAPSPPVTFWGCVLCVSVPYQRPIFPTPGSKPYKIRLTHIEFIGRLSRVISIIRLIRGPGIQENCLYQNGRQWDVEEQWLKRNRWTIEGPICVPPHVGWAPYLPFIISEFIFYIFVGPTPHQHLQCAPQAHNLMSDRFD